MTYICSFDKMSSFRRNFPQIIAVMIKNILLTSYGIGLGYPTVLIAGLLHSNEFNVGSDETSWLGSANLIAVPVGCIFSGYLSQTFGRKRTMILLNVPLFVAWMISGLSNKLWQIYLAQVLMGLLNGLIEAPVIAYVSEITTPKLRGTLSSTGPMFSIIGVLVQFMLGTFFSWRNCALISSVFPVITFIILFIVPESPRWFLIKERPKQAKESLAWLRGWVSITDIEEEFKNLEKEMDDSAEISASFFNFRESKYFKTSFLKPFGLVTFAFFLLQFGGITNVQTYAVEIFTTFKAPIDSYYLTVVLGTGNVLGCILSVFLIHVAGKRNLNFVVMIISAIFSVSIASYAFNSNVFDLELNLSKAENSTFSKSNSTGGGEDHMNNWIPTVCLICFTFFSHVGVRSLPWILTGEVFTNNMRSVASGLASAVCYVFAFIANKLFLIMVEWFTIGGVFLLYSVILIVGVIVLHFILPETEGKSLAEISAHYTGGKKLTNTVRRRNDLHENDK